MGAEEDLKGVGMDEEWEGVEVVGIGVVVVQELLKVVIARDGRSCGRISTGVWQIVADKVAIQD